MFITYLQNKCTEILNVSNCRISPRQHSCVFCCICKFFWIQFCLSRSSVNNPETKLRLCGIFGTFSNICMSKLVLISFLNCSVSSLLLDFPASTTYKTNKGPKWVLIWGLCGRPIWAPVSFCKWFSDGTNMVYQ